MRQFQWLATFTHLRLMDLSRPHRQIVDNIAAVSISGKSRSIFSFASKYCSWHDPINYPLYDAYVEELLLAYRDKDDFAGFKKSDLRRYAFYKKIISDFRNYYCLQRYSFKELDKFLWLYGKTLNPKTYKVKGK